MFNFFNELKAKAGGKDELFCEFNLVNMSGHLIYVEGHLGLTILSPTMIAFKIKKGRIVIEGENLILSELTDNTMLIQGKIVKMEQF